MERIYVAGFDVFYPDWKEKRYFEYRELCGRYGFEMQAQKAAPNEGKTLGTRFFEEHTCYRELSVCGGQLKHISWERARQRYMF